MVQFTSYAVSAAALCACFVTALPAASSEEPSKTVAARDAAPQPDFIGNIFAAAGMGIGREHGFGGGPNNDAQCDLSQATMPTDDATTGTPLPKPSGTLAYVAVGRGTQNYTCDPASPTASPSPIGAVANLYDASCIAGHWPSLLTMLPAIALQFPVPDLNANGMINMDLLGHHYFTDATSPTFNLDTSNGNAGYVNVKAVGKVPAPSGAPVGQNGKGNGAVPWLYLPQRTGTQGVDGQQTFQEVFRVNTAGGQSPSTCEGMPSAFEVEYAAEYWFFK